MAKKKRRRGGVRYRECENPNTTWILTLDGIPIASFTFEPSQEAQDGHLAYQSALQSPITKYDAELMGSLRKRSAIEQTKLFYPRKNKMDYIRKYQYPVDVILDKVREALENDIPEMDFDGDMIKMFSDRYKCFLHNGTTCIWCGIKGTHFGKERDVNAESDANPERFHFNLYAQLGTGKGRHEILMTKDHIIPKSKGGSNHHTNLQTMCIRCNNLKGSEII